VNTLSALARALRHPGDADASARALRPLAEHSERLLRRPYARNALGPFLLRQQVDFPPELRERWELPSTPFAPECLPRTPAARRWFAVVHDMTHALTGYPPEIHGEVLVGLFMLGCWPVDPLAAATVAALAVYPLHGLRPPSRRDMRDAFRWGTEISPRRLHATPYENLQDHSLSDIRIVVGLA